MPFKFAGTLNRVVIRLGEGELGGRKKRSKQSAWVSAVLHASRRRGATDYFFNGRGPPGRRWSARRGKWVDPDDAPEWTEEQFARADLYHGDKLIRRGRPPSDNPKQAKCASTPTWSSTS